MDSPIPLIDISACTPEELAKDIKAAVSSVGFLHLTGTGISREEISKAFAIAKEFFDEPAEEKGKFPSDYKNGYMSFKSSRLGEGKGRADLKENFVYGRYVAPLTATAQPLPPVFMAHLEEVQSLHAKLYQVTCLVLDGEFLPATDSDGMHLMAFALLLTPACALALNLPVDYFRERHSAGGCGLAFNNYPEVSKEDAAVASDAARASSHKDWGSITLLMQEEEGTPGLEVFLPDGAVEASQSGKPYRLHTEMEDAGGKWFQAPVVPGAILVNLGLALESWTRGLFVATLHRVISHPTPEGGFKGRKSMAYFVQPIDDVVLNPINADGTVEENAHAVTSGAFFATRMANTIKAIAV